jgi:molybdenum cofactor cytidylyltransferase
MSIQSKIAILIMAAGGSSRMGTPKQLLKWKDSNLLDQTISKAIQLKSEVVVVLGANSDKIIPKIDQNKVSILVNQNWELGLGSSISEGIKFIQLSYPDLLGVLIMLSDQPLIELDHYLSLIDVFTSGSRQIIVTKYGDGKLGVPALFDKFYFKDLCNLNSDKGAKKLFDKYSEFVNTIRNKQANIDIDTCEEYEILYKANHDLKKLF